MARTSRSGTIKRANARVTVLRGFDPNQPTTLTQSLPVTSSVTVLSGQVVSPSWSSAAGSQAWVLGLTGGTPFIALQDSADEDVDEAGKLTGLSCAGQFEIQTAFYSGTESTFTYGALLSAHATSGSLTVAAATGATIVGLVTRIPSAAVGTAAATYGGITVTQSYATATGASYTGAGATYFAGSDSSVTAPEKVLTFTTAYSGAKTSA